MNEIFSRFKIKEKYLKFYNDQHNRLRYFPFLNFYTNLSSKMSTWLFYELLKNIAFNNPH